MTATAVSLRAYNARMEQNAAATTKHYWWRTNSPTQWAKSKQAMRGDTCSYCQKGTLAFDGLFNLICDNCGRVRDTAVFT